MEMTTSKTQVQRTTDKLQKDVLSRALRPIVRSRTVATETRNVLATRDVHARGFDADPGTAPMTSATLPHSSTATNLRRRWDVERSFASMGGIT